MTEIKKVVVFDIDGTLTNSDHRKEHAENGDYDTFNSLCLKDTPYLVMIDIAKKYKEAGFEIHAYSGRSSLYLESTIEYFKELGVEFDLIKTRAEGNLIPAKNLKGSWIQKNIINEGKELVCVFEDDDVVIGSLRNKGYKVVDVKVEIDRDNLPVHQKVVLVDIDGTVMDNSDREYHISNGSKDFDYYHAAFKNDKPIQEIIDKVNDYKNKGYLVMMYSNRPEKHHEETKKQLIEVGLNFNEVYLKPKKDGWLKSELVKENYVRDIESKGYKVELIIDDTEKVIQHFQSKGYKVVHPEELKLKQDTTNKLKLK